MSIFCLPSLKVPILELLESWHLVYWVDISCSNFTRLLYPPMSIVYKKFKWNKARHSILFPLEYRRVVEAQEDIPLSKISDYLDSALILHRFALKHSWTDHWKPIDTQLTNRCKSRCKQVQNGDRHKQTIDNHKKQTRQSAKCTRGTFCKWSEILERGIHIFHILLIDHWNIWFLQISPLVQAHFHCGK